MDAITKELKSLLEREQIRDCIARLARGEDRRNAELISACYWPDSTSDYGVFLGTFAQYLAWVVPGSSAIPVTQHVLGQSVIELHGDVARSETQVISYHRVKMGMEERDTIIGGRYLDRMEKRGGEWRIAQRTLVVDWTARADITSLPDTAAHPPPKRDRTDPSYSRPFRVRAAG